ncbi:unnamed protein product, partial [Ixodes hexagonus]
LALTCTVILLFVFHYIHFHYAGCHEPGCMDVVSDLQEIMDTTADPCLNFYQFVCGNFERAYPWSDSYIQVVELRMREAYRAMLETHQESVEHTVIESTVRAFRRCMRDYKDRVDNVEPLRKLYRRLQQTWKASGSGRSQAGILGFLMSLSLKFGLPVFLKANVTQDLRSRNNSVLQLEVQDAGPPLDRPIIEDILRRVHKNAQWLESTPKAIGYGQLGTEMAELLVRSLYPSEPSLHRKVEWLSTRGDLNDSTECVRKSRIDYTGEDAGEDALFEDWASLIGLRVAFKAFSNSTPWEEAERPFVTGVNSGWQAFFVASCLRRCWAASRTGASAADAKCNLPAMHSKDFALAFGCAPETRMNPTTKCD